MSINNTFTEPGVFSQFKPVSTFPVLPGGVRVTALVGAGRTTNVVTGESVTKVSGDTDGLAHDAVSLGATITDEDFETYTLDVDYQLTSGDVQWKADSPAISITGTTTSFTSLVGLTFKITVDGGTEQSYTFVSGDFVAPATPTITEIVAAINTNTTGITASSAAGALKLTDDVLFNASLEIGNGTSNTILGLTGFVGGAVSGVRRPAVGKVFSVDYEYDKVSADYIPRFFFSMADVQAEHGNVSTTNTLSLGAEIVFEQNASAVCLIQVDPADGSITNQFKKAIDKLSAVDNINIVVALTTDASIPAYLKAHVNAASSITERKERSAIVAMAATPTLNQLTATAAGLNNKRMVLVDAYACKRFVGADTTVSVLDGTFIAAAIAGVRTSRTYDVAEPLTRKTIVGFEDLTDPWLRTEKVLMLSKGVMVIENINGVFRVMQQVTTDVSTRENNEYSVVETIDFVGSNMRQILENIFIGNKILSGTPSQVKSTVTTVLNNLITSEIIVSFQNVQAAVNNTDPTQIDVSFEIRPVFPLNYILITFSLSANQ